MPDCAVAAPPLDPTPQYPYEAHVTTYDIVHWVFKDADTRAQNAGLNYPRLGHLALLHELLSHETQSSLSPFDRKVLWHERWNLAWEAVDLYRTCR